jgi:aryl-alcohol dehydrogenase-like predicted oxidoreductase
VKLGLGTVQFGTDYGVSNKLGQTDPAEVSQILEFAADCGIRYLDTSPAYGNSESVLGKYLKPSHQFRIVTKTDKIGKLRIDDRDVELVLATFRRSLQNLNQKSVYGLLVHHPDDLLEEGGGKLFQALESLKTEGLVKKIGVSVYDRTQIEKLLDKYLIDLIQVPLNVFDQRLLKHDYLGMIKSQGLEIHVRSVFLQGILLMSKEELPIHLSGFSPYLQKWEKTLNLYGLSPLQAAICFVSNLPNVDRILIGVNNINQLIEIVNISYQQILSQDDTDRLAVQDINLINPSLWNQQ